MTLGVLYRLYDCFYTPPKLIGLKQSIESDHQELIGRLEKPERKLVLRIIDNGSMITLKGGTDVRALANLLGCSRPRNTRQAFLFVWMSVPVAVCAVFLFTLIVNFLTRKKIGKVDMVEALKSVE